MTGYTPSQTTAIQAYIVERLADVIKTDGFIDCSWSDVIARRGQQSFAVFGSTAYKLLGASLATIDAPIVISDHSAEFHYVPVLVDGKMFRMDPEEGRGGLLYLMQCVKRRGIPFNGEWICLEISTGWLHSDELRLSDHEILDNIADEIDSGATHLTGGMPGWA